MRLFYIICFALFLQNATSQNSKYQLSSISENLLKNADAVVRLDEMTVEITAVDKMVIKKKRVVTVLNEKGSVHVHTSVGYNNSRKVKDIQAVIYNTSGREIDKIREKDFIDVSAVDGGTLYSDSRMKFMRYTPTEYPYTIEFTSEITTRNTGEIPSWYFLDGYRVSVEKSRYKVNYISEELKPRVKEKNLNRIDLKKEEIGNNSVEYRASNIVAVKKEQLAPSFSKISPQLNVILENFNYEGYIGSIKNWKDFGTWMYSNLLQGRDDIPLGTKEKVKSLVNGVTDDLEKSKIIYKYVQDNTRYISVQVGVSGVQPISAIDVDRVKYGDCKGLSNYTKGLLNAVGVPAFYTHVEAGRNKVDFDEDFPSLAAGNHVILAIPYNDDYYWIDCTSKIHPFGFIGDFTDDRKVLIMKPEGGELVRTKSYIDKENYQRTEAVYTINEKGDIAGDVTINTKGIQYDNRFYLEDRKNDDIIKHYKQYWNTINNLKIINHAFSNDRDQIVFSEKVKIEAVSYGTISGDRILFAVNAFNKNTNVPSRYRNRKLPFEIQRGYLDEDEFIIKIPKNYIVEALPETKNIETKFGNYKITAELQDKGKSIKYKRSLLVKKGVYAKDEYTIYRNFRKQIASLENLKVALIKK